MKNSFLFCISIVSLLTLAACGQSDSQSDSQPEQEIIWISTIPQPKDEQFWLDKHAEDVANAAAAKGNVDLLFVGDSLIERWETYGEKVWNHYYAHRKPLNIALGGDGTEQVLWRLENGAIQGLKPSVVVINVGTNNSYTALEFGLGGVVEGIWAVAKLLEEKLPETEILLVGVLPRQHRQLELRLAIKDWNRELEELAQSEERIHYFEVWDEYLIPETHALRAELMDDIALHPTEAGYKVWAEAMEPILSDLLGDEPVKPKEVSTEATGVET